MSYMPSVRALSISVVLIATWTADAIAQPTLPTRDFVMVSLGDSAAAGEGAPNAPATSRHSASWNDSVCHRSFNAPVVLAFNALKMAHPNVHFAGDSLGHIKHFACSGAGILNGLIEPQQWDNDKARVAKSQIQQVRDWLGAPDPADPHPKIDALLINIGANDVGFEKLVKACMLLVKPNLNPFWGPRDLNDCSQGVGEDLFSAGIAKLPALYDRLIGEIKRQLPYVANVYITEYPDPTHDAAGNFCNGGPFPDFAGLTSAEARWASQRVVADLNQQIANAVVGANYNSRTTWHMVTGISSQFATHGVCSDSNYVSGSPGNRLINTLGDSLMLQSAPYECNVPATLAAFLALTMTTPDIMLHMSNLGPPSYWGSCDYSGTMHPNAAGYRAYQAPIVAALSPLFDKPAAPRNLIRGTMTPTAISIKWIDNSINEDVFQIRHRTGANAWTTVQVPWRTQSWTLDGMTLGQTHIFEVQSCSYIAQSCSDWVPLSVVLQPPAAPSNVHFARIRVPRINVPGGVPRPSYIDYSIQWNDNSNNEESFEIEMLEGSTWTSLRTVSANETVLHFGDNSLDIGLTGHYRVRACISKVCSDWSMSP